SQPAALHRAVPRAPALEVEPADAQDHGHPMNFELSQRFFFEATHTLDRKIDAETSRRYHGHTYHAEVTIRGTRDPATGMVSDLAALRAQIETVRAELDHQLLDDVPGLGVPTLENLSLFIAQR